MVQSEAFAPQQDVQTAIAKAPPHRRDLTQADPYGHIVRPPAAIADRAAIRTNRVACPPLAHSIHLEEVIGGLASGGGRHHFLAATSRNIALSSIASANSCFSLVFSSSSAFSRRASETSIPPYLAFHLKGSVADAVLAAYLNRLCPCLLLPQDRDNLLLTESATLHRPSPSRVGLYSNLEEV